MPNFFTLVSFSFNSRTFSILGVLFTFSILDVWSSLSQITPKNLTNLCIFGMDPSYSVLSSILLKKLFWSLSKLLLSNVLLPLVIIFTSFTHLCLRLSINASLCFIRTGVVGSVSFIVFLNCLTIFFPLVCPLFVVFSDISHYWFLQSTALSQS